MTPQEHVPEQGELRLFEVDDGESWWIVAKDHADALRFARDRYEIPTDPDEAEVAVTVCDPDKPKTIGWGDDGWDPLPEGAVVEEGPHGLKRVTASVRAWVAIHSEGDLVCSTCW